MSNDTTLRTTELRAALTSLDTAARGYASEFVELLLAAARDVHVSDVHLQPTPEGLEIRWRLDGVLQPVGVFSSGKSADVVSRLKVLAELLTYRTDVPQEGRIAKLSSGPEIRVSSFPTLHGERAVLRFFDSQKRFHFLHDLGLDDEQLDALRRATTETSGALIICGPAGSGKTTTAYALLREVVQSTEGGRSVMSIEDPIEVAVEGVSQSQAAEQGDFTLQSGLKSLLRQDPEVILVGEIRDPGTAEQVFQASLTGHLVLTTFHAGSAAEALSRLADMNVEPYQLRSGLLSIVSQRLLRQLCGCSREIAEEAAKLGLPVASARESVGCETCLQTGYHDRFLLSELLDAKGEALGPGILARQPAGELARLAVQDGMVTFAQQTVAAVESGRTSPAEVRRVFGFR